MSDLNEMLAAWYDAEQKASYFKVLELELRNKLFALAFPTPELGTNKIKLDHGKALVATYKMNYRIDQALMESMRKEPELLPIIEQVVAYSPKLRDGAFNKLSDNERGQIAAFVTETPATPALEIKDAARLRWNK